MPTAARARLVVASLLLAATPAAAQLAALQFDPLKVPVGRVYQYLKSNRDGSHPGRVSLCVAGLDRLESLKWDDEIGWATFVVAEMDWTRFAELGEVRLRYEGREQRGETKTRRYRPEGPGLSDAVGTLWTDAAEGHLVEFELPIPDEPGFTDGRLRLLGVERMTPSEWGSFQRARLGE